ncbi:MULTISPECIES: type II toxin-antitoxin system VapC family toxin [Mesorhizobium]|uniref:PIN domain nuclease, a component of toxin-antitoxin system (PIN domain) n=1 Tax=Mesorhizobium muleiense TaxID=1004279 RepID=A0A1G8IXH4_9HYPH|nr:MULTISPECIES: type II toxin-antitoxin system VapC family toxin [Mesorhizobium]ESZ17979.1 twitching motility protein PilT [Mesorhizobium sp. L48C026A00]MCF6099814.1 type II toxin-antitoxin system VapC family toxin [Mesorhizobium muleiense]TIM25040.1 MAG: type II toxin-antitoxin system VapC family toxin [Mesorhizobium sp.]SDI23684.1 PIN domain nuclease, a component of toxin-antitoxin system (PIN domain) [Mesorhizobium muleiense]
MKAYVMDSSAALAILLNEKGTDVALGFAPDAQFSSVNAAEIIAKLIDKGRSMEEAADDLASLGMPVAAFDEMMGIAAGQLRELTRHRGLSLGDRACLALAIRENAIAVTADRGWGDLDIGCKIELIR